MRPKKTAEMVIRKLASIICFLGLALHALSAPDLSVRISPIFQGGIKSSGLLPLRVTVTNEGPDARGAVHVEGGNYPVSYPVELPRNSKKDLTIFITASEFTGLGPSQVVLETDHGTVLRAIDPTLTDTAGAGVEMLLEIGGNPGDCEFLAAEPDTSHAHILGASYIDPEAAPDRLAAYSGFVEVILASGSERLSDGAIRALRLYVLRGGVLVIPGGVASPLLSDGRWNGLIPISPKGPQMISGDTLLRSMAKHTENKKVIKSARIGGPYSVINFDPLPGTKVFKEGGQNLLAVRPYGLGRVVFWGFDPFSGAIRNWPSRAAFFKRTVAALAPGVRRGANLASTDENDDDSPFGSSSTTPPPPMRSSFGPSSSQQSAFQVHTPQPSQIALILFLYFIFVIPINFVVLHKLKRREWAWVTSGLISLVFTGVMLSQASSLYGLPTSTANTAYVVAQQGWNEAAVHGRAQIFFLNGGRYDLKMSSVDSIEPRSQSPYDYSGPKDTLSMFGARDVGELKLDSANVSNLAFGELSYEQTISGKWISVQRNGAGYDIHADIPLKNVTVMTPQGNASLAQIEAGTTTAIKKGQLMKSDDDAGKKGAFSNGPPLGEENVDFGEVVISAEAPSLPVGPSVGKQIKASTTLIYFARVTP